MDLYIVVLGGIMIFFAGVSLPVFLLGKAAREPYDGAGCFINGVLAIISMPIVVCGGLLIYYLVLRG